MPKVSASGEVIVVADCFKPMLSGARPYLPSKRGGTQNFRRRIQIVPLVLASQRVLRKVRSLPLLFWLMVVIPTLISTVYYGVFASDVYISESHFVVRSPEKPSMAGVGLLLKSSAFSNAGEQIYATKDYLTSRDALEAVNRNGSFLHAFSKSSISIFDRFNGFGNGGGIERLYKYYLGKVKVDYDSSTSITTLTVKAYSAGDARKFNEELLRMAENTVNEMSERGRRDLIEVAQVEVGEAKEKAQDASVALATYRNQVGVIDPEKQASVQVQMISKLQDELIATKTQLIQMRTLANQSPMLPVLKTREAFLEREIEAQLGQVAGDQKSLAASAVRYERLSLENEFAAKQLASAVASLEEAKSEARRKRAYVERVVQPNLPDYPLEPKRIKGVFTTLVLGLVLWGILSMLLAGMLEHKD